MSDFVPTGEEKRESKPVAISSCGFYDPVADAGVNALYVLLDDGRIFERWQSGDNPSKWTEIKRKPWVSFIPDGA